jgi:hypothetical protein
MFLLSAQVALVLLKSWIAGQKDAVSVAFSMNAA